MTISRSDITPYVIYSIFKKLFYFAMFLFSIVNC
jgi:hypothetical protein